MIYIYLLLMAAGVFGVFILKPKDRIRSFALILLAMNCFYNENEVSRKLVSQSDFLYIQIVFFLLLGLFVYCLQYRENR